LPQRLLQRKVFRRHHIIFIAVPEQQRSAGQGRQLLADIPRPSCSAPTQAKEKVCESELK
jgi:hypothetical protein